MDDLEKVIKELAVRIQSDSEEWNTIELPIEQAKDILALLKAHEPVKPKFGKHEIDGCKPVLCGNCLALIGFTPRVVDYIKYCPECGRKVDWND